MKEHAFRLARGADLKKSIVDYCRNHHIGSAVILTAVGSVYEVAVRKAKATTIFRDASDYEILSLSGTVARDKAHLHIALADESMRTIGGHLMEETYVNTTAEIVLLELEEFDFHREFDENTGYDELVIRRK